MSLPTSQIAAREAAAPAKGVGKNLRGQTGTQASAVLTHLSLEREGVVEPKRESREKRYREAVFF